MTAPRTSRTRARLTGLLASAAAVAVALGAVIGTGGGVSSAPSQPAEDYPVDKPNVVVVMTDDQAVDTLRAMPHTKRLIGRRGVEFKRAVASYPLCCPSRASFMTGQYAHNHGVLSNNGPRGGYKRLDTKRTLPVWLQAAGYETGFVGKFLNGYGKNEDVLEVPRGWSEWYATPGEGKQRAFDFDLNENGKLVPYRGRSGNYKTRVLSDKASGFVREQAPKRRPFFLWVAANAPHSDGGLPPNARRNPEPAPDDDGRFDDARAPRPPAFDVRGADKPPFVANSKNLGRAQRRKIDRFYVSQLESLVAVDRMVRQLVRELRRSGELERTVFMFTSDNGYLRGQHRIIGKSKVYEESIRVPLMIRGPGFPRHVIDRHLVANVDLAPTILWLTGAKADVRVDGRSLIPYERRAAEGRGAPVVLEVFERRGALRGLRTERYAYAEHDKKGRRELYDMRRDPHQLRNVAGRPAYAKAERRLERRLADLRDCAGAECR